MKKRLRKKLRLAEFSELGFAVSFQLTLGLTAQEGDRLLDAFIREAIEANGLLCGEAETG